MTSDNIPDGVPDETEFDPQASPYAVPRNQANAIPVVLGLDHTNGLIIIQLGEGPDAIRTGVPIASALEMAHNILGKCLTCLMGPPPPEAPQSKIVLPEDF